MYAQKIRRQLHMYPEVGFDLDRTLQLLREELDKLGDLQANKADYRGDCYCRRRKGRVYSGKILS